MRWTTGRGTCSFARTTAAVWRRRSSASTPSAGVTFDATRGGLVIQTLQARELATWLPRLARDASIRLHEVRPLDDSLESLFRELVR